MLDISNPILEILAYAILIPVSIIWGFFVLGMLIAGLRGIISMLFPRPNRTWEQRIKDHENMVKFNSLIIFIEQEIIFRNKFERRY